MADGIWKDVYHYVFGRSKQLSLNKIFDPSTPSMRKGRVGEWKMKNKIMTFIVATNTSLPVGRPNADQLEHRTLVPITHPKIIQK